MKGVAERTIELLNEFQKVQFTKSYRDFQHFLVVKIEELEDEIKKNKELKELVATILCWKQSGHKHPISKNCLRGQEMIW